jgi:hypothetical protein
MHHYRDHVIIGGSRQQPQQEPQQGPQQPATGRPGDEVPGLDDGSPARRPWWVWTIPFAVLTAVLVARNWFLFSTKLYEQGDMASNSLRIEEARHFTLLIGDYSRLRFSHPGPAYFYVQAWGEELFYDLLHWTPTAWNAQILAVYALNSAWVALAVGVVYGWTRSVRGAAVALAVFAAAAVLHPIILSSDWMSFLYVPTYTIFVIAAASVAAGRGQDAWILALSGWFLIHGHAAYLFFVPALTAAVLVALLWPVRRTLRASIADFFARHRGVWVSVAVISLIFLLPILVNVSLHWPGDFGKYFSYGSSQTGGHPIRKVIHYVLWFWWPTQNAPSTAVLALVPVLLYAAAAALMWWFAAPAVRRFGLAVLAMNAVSTLAFVFYSFTGVDDLSSKGYYIGYFYWSAPLITVLVIAVGLVEVVARPPRHAALSRRTVLAVTAASIAVAVAAVAVFAARPLTRTPTAFTNPYIASFAPDTDPAIPHLVAVAEARSPGKELVFKLDHNAWRDMNGILVQAYRTGARACIDDPWWEFMVTDQFICTPQQVKGGAKYYLWDDQSHPAGHVLARVYDGRLTAGWPK